MQWKTTRLLLLLLPLLVRPVRAGAQRNYLDNPLLLEQVDSCLYYTYSCAFEKAQHFQSILIRQTPNHPAPVFLNALILYWEHFPLTTSSKKADEFIEQMDIVVERAQSMLGRPESRTEGVFFDLFGRAFKAMFYADNNKTSKVIPDLNRMYRATLDGFELKEELPEFYFSSGMYNYYIEAYPEAHPVYKPLISFMHRGDKKQGLRELNTSIQKSVFLRTESILFMSLIHLFYEYDLSTAALYAERLHREFPANRHYQGVLMSIEIHRHRFDRVKSILKQTEGQNDPYSTMIRLLGKAFLCEMEEKDYRRAATAYEKAAAICQDIGPPVRNYQAIAYMGQSRISLAQGSGVRARKFRRAAQKLSNYPFIINEKGNDSR